MTSLLQKKGFSIVESVIAVSIIGVFVVVLAGVNNLYLSIAFSNSEKLKAYFLAEEGIEAVKSMRDHDWSANIATLTPGVQYRLAFEPPVWKTYANILEEESFTRVLTVEDVYRNSNAEIDIGGTLDPDTKLITVTVSWQSKGLTESIYLKTYVTNLFETT